MMSPRILTHQPIVLLSCGADLRDSPSQDVESSYEGYGVGTLKVSRGGDTIIVTIRQLYTLIADVHLGRQSSSSGTHKLVRA